MNTSSVPVPLSKTSFSCRNVFPTFFMSLSPAVTATHKKESDQWGILMSLSPAVTATHKKESDQWGILMSLSPAVTATHKKESDQWGILRQESAMCG